MISLSYEQKLVWLACLIDGEGWITAGIYPSHTDKTEKIRKRFKPMIGVVNTDIRLINLAAEIMTEITGRVPAMSVRDRSRPLNHKAAYRAHFGTFDTIHRLLKAIRPYLVIKGEQADIVMSMIEHRQHLISRHWKRGPEANVEADGWLNEQLGPLHALNRRGVIV